MPSISDDDLCSRCSNCAYKPGGNSSCVHDFPGTPDEDGYIVKCGEYLPEPITMTPEQVQAAIAGYDLKTFNGWTDAAIALLQDKPERTALQDASGAGYMVLIDGSLTAVPANKDGSLTFAMEGDSPEGSCDPDANAWSEHGCWDCSTPEQDMRTLTDPVFVTLSWSPVETLQPQPTQADLVRAAARAKQAHWDALIALERSYPQELTDKQNEVMCERIDLLASSATGSISDESIQEVLSAIASA